MASIPYIPNNFTSDANGNLVQKPTANLGANNNLTVGAGANGQLQPNAPVSKASPLNNFTVGAGGSLTPKNPLQIAGAFGSSPTQSSSISNPSNFSPNTSYGPIYGPTNPMAGTQSTNNPDAKVATVTNPKPNPVTVGANGQLQFNGAPVQQPTPQSTAQIASYTAGTPGGSVSSTYKPINAATGQQVGTSQTTPSPVNSNSGAATNYQLKQYYNPNTGEVSQYQPDPSVTYTYGGTYQNAGSNPLPPAPTSDSTPTQDVKNATGGTPTSTGSLTSAPAQNNINSLYSALQDQQNNLQQEIQANQNYYSNLGQQQNANIQGQYNIQGQQLDQQHAGEKGSANVMSLGSGLAGQSFMAGLQNQHFLQNQTLHNSENQALSQSMQALNNQEYERANTYINQANTAFGQRLDLAKTAQDAQQFQQNFQLQAQQNLFNQNQQMLEFQLNSNKFTYQQGQDAIKNSLDQGQLDATVAKNLNDYNYQIQSLKQSGLTLTTDPLLGTPLVFDKSTNSFVTPGNGGTPGVSGTPSIPGSTGLPGTGGLRDTQNEAYLNAIFSATSGITSAEAKQADNRTLNNFLENGDVQGAKEFLTKLAMESLPGTAQDAALGRVQMLGQLTQIKSALNAYVQSSGDTNILKGNLENFSEKLGATTDPKLANLRSLLATVTTDFNHNLYGSRLTDTEINQSKNILPDINNVNTLNLGRITTLMNQLNNDQKTAIGSQIGQSTYDQIFGVAARPASVEEFQQAQPEQWAAVAPLVIQNNLTNAQALQLIFQKFYPQSNDVQPFNQPVSSGENSSPEQIASAIKQVESGGDYNAQGKSGETGAYQFMPSSWKSWAGQYLGNDNAPMTPENQDKVAIARISDLLQQGNTPREVALIWNGGEPIEKKGVNKFGVPYDSGDYANKVLSTLNS